MLQRITVPEILKNAWFRKGYKAPKFEQEENLMNLDDVDAVFNNSEVTYNFYTDKCILLCTVIVMSNN